LNKGVEQQFLRLIPPDASVVVEMGCAEGQLGACYKRRNPKGRYIGVEAATDAADAATNVLDQVIVTEPSPESVEEAGLNNVDCLITHGHLLSDTEPWKDIQRLSAAISDTGVLLASFENAEHWGHIGKFFHGSSQMKTY